MLLLQESVTEPHKEETSSISTIPKLLELNLEESHKTWGDEVEDALKLQEYEAWNKTGGARDSDRRPDMGSADFRRFDGGRTRGDRDDRPPAKKMRDEPSLYRSQRDGGYSRDRTRGGRGRGKVDSFRGGRSSTNDFRYSGNRDSVVSEYQPSRGEKRGTLTFERSDLHTERQTSFENKRGQYRSGDGGGRQGREDRNRDGRGKDGRESYGKKDDRANTGKMSEARSTSEVVGTFAASSDHEPARTNAWNLPLHGPKQSSDPTRLDEIPDITQWNVDSGLAQQEGGTDKEASRKHPADSLEKPEIASGTAESRGNDRERLAGFRGEGYRDRGPRQSRRGRRQNWSEQAEGGEGVPRYPQRSHPRREGRGPRSGEDPGEEPDETTSREDRNQGDRRRSSRFGSGGRGLRQSGHGEYSMRSRGRGTLSFI